MVAVVETDAHDLLGLLDRGPDALVAEVELAQRPGLDETLDATPTVGRPELGVEAHVVAGEVVGDSARGDHRGLLGPQRSNS